MEKIRKYLYLGLFLFAVVIFLIHYAVSGQAVYGDGIGYYSHLHSFVIDGDFDYTNEYKHIYDHEHNNLAVDSLAPAVQIVSTMENGKAENFYSTGVAILLLPFYLLAHLITLVLNLFHAGLSTLGYGDLYQILTGIGAIFYCITGLLFLEKTINYVIRDAIISLISSLTIFLATSLLYYGSFDVINSHFASFFLSSVFFYLFISGGNKVKNNLLLGFVAGLLTINRVQDSVVVVIWFIDALRKSKLFIKSAGKFLAGFIFGIIPLIVHWSMVFGNPLQHPYLRGLLEKYQKSPIMDIFGSLFNPVTGLFFRTPMLLVIFIFFLYLAWKKDIKNLFYPFLFFVMQFLIITAQGGWAAAAYGGRMYISSLIFFGLVLGKLLLRIGKKKFSYVYLIVSIFIAINFVSMALFIVRDKGAEGGTFGTEQRTIQRIENILK